LGPQVLINESWYYALPEQRESAARHLQRRDADAVAIEFEFVDAAEGGVELVLHADIFTQYFAFNMDGVARQVDLGDRRMGDRISQFQKADRKGGRGAKTAARSRQVRPFGKRQLAPDCVVIPRSIGRTALDSRNSSLGFMSAQRGASAHFPGNSLGPGSSPMADGDSNANVGREVRRLQS
jgi:hypothetical protein